MKILQLALMLLSTSVFSAHASSFPANLEGTYDCKAKEIETNEVSMGVCTLKKTGKTYSLTSKFSDGSTYHGVGIYDQEAQLLAIGSINPTNEKETGVALVRVEKNGNLKAEWTYLNKSEIGETTCTKRMEA